MNPITLGDKDWQHPAHVGGIKPPRIFDNIVGKRLTNRRIDHYTRNGFYSNRRHYRREAKILKKVQAAMKPKTEKRLVYNTATQDFEEREF